MHVTHYNASNGIDETSLRMGVLHALIEQLLQARTLANPLIKYSHN